MQEIEPPIGTPIIEGPPKLLPDLTAWGIEEVERGVCEDNFENRKTIKQNKARWVTVFDSNGYPTDLIQVISPEMYQLAQAGDRKPILTDPDNPDSDYLTGFALLIEERAPEIVPTWVFQITRNWQKLEDKREELGSDASALDSRLVYPPGRCNAKKADNTRCWGWHNGTTDMDFLCKIHARSHQQGKNRPTYGPTQMQLSRNRLASAAVGATEILEDLANNAVSEQVRLGAVNSILDRFGLRGGIEIEQKVEITESSAAADVAKKLAKLKEGLDEKAELLDRINRMRYENEEVEDAEVVEDGDQ